MSKRDSALSLAVKGWRLFPCTPNSKIPMKGWTDWEGRATDDVDEINRIWSDTPNANVGLATGPSGLVVVDFDSAKNPQETSGIENFRAEYPGRKLPATYTVKTWSGGWHLYYLAPTDVALRNTAGKQGRGLAEKVDTRGSGGYVLAPGSHVSGSLYEVTSNAPVVDLPEWLTKKLQDVPTTRTEVVPKGDSTSYALAALRRECEALAACQEGGRNHACNRAAWNVSRFVARGELSEVKARNDLTIAASRCGLTGREPANAIDSGMTRGIKHYAK